jgi:hypothetical protein
MRWGMGKDHKCIFTVAYIQHTAAVDPTYIFWTNEVLTQGRFTYRRVLFVHSLYV